MQPGQRTHHTDHTHILRNYSEDHRTGYILRSDAVKLIVDDKFTQTLGSIRRDIDLFREDTPVGETILGSEIVDERDTVTDMQQLARERWRKRGKR